MVKAMYIVWALLPVILFYMSASAKVRKTAKRLKEGYAKFYFRQAIYSAIFLAIAVIIDQNFFYDLFDPVAQFLTSNPETALTIGAWLIYPMLLAFAAGAQQLFSKKDESKVIYRSYR